MLATRISRIERRGIVLVLVLAMLGLLALIGVTFATFSSQARINARNYAQSLLEPQGDELLDFALSQLITETNDPRSALRGHSLARDMYGNDGFVNGYMTASPSTGVGFCITGIAPSPTLVGSTGQPLYLLTTNILSNDSTFYGFNFTRWIMRVAYTGPTTSPVTWPQPSYSAGSYTSLQPVNQTFEILIDSGAGTQATNRVFTVDLIDSATTLLNPSYYSGSPPNQTATPSATQLPALYLLNASSPNNLGNPSAFPFILDGRWLHAFNGTGVAGGGGNPAWGNFKFNGSSPNQTSMDEDYDACDLENWFLAIQSADGQVVIPSFHRPSIIRYDPNGATPVNDWQNVNALNANNPAAGFVDSASRILRPRNFDGNDATTFPDLVPSPATGKITYDVDNDADGITDSVWLDLGYPARRDSRGQLYKPLFSFMVIGLNGKIPLNTAGNLAATLPGTQFPPPIPGPAGPSYGGGPTVAQHLGNTVSEIDPTYALQNANLGPNVDFDPFNVSSGLYSTPSTTPSTSNTQVDNATFVGSGGVAMPIDVRLTQLRNILAGTRPQPNPSVISSTSGDNNFIYGSWPATGVGSQLYMPNGIADGSDVIFALDSSIPTPLPTVLNTNPPVAGRWGEAASIPGGIAAPNVASPPAINGYVNLVRSSYQNSVRAGYSYDLSDILSGAARDAADDDYDMFDPWPIGHTGEMNDLDMYDGAGALILPVDRYRRFVTPADIDGTGRITPWSTNSESLSGTNYKASRGADVFGRVLFSSHYRPPGAPGAINTNYVVTEGMNGALNTYAPPAGAPQLGTIVYPGNAFFYTGGPNAGSIASPNYLPDMTTNPLHGFESFKIPNIYATTPNPTPPPANLYAWSPGSTGGMVVDQPAGNPTPVTTAAGIPSTYPTYDLNIHDDALNHADELNLYNPNPLLDSPYKAGDLEWLYRQQDVDGASLSSRLAQLAPVSFTNTIDGQRRRRLFALDSWDMNNFVWANDNPNGVFANNSTFGVKQSANFANYTSYYQKLNSNPNVYVSTPPLAQRDKKINLNLPLPVSNDPAEPVRQKWINDAYQLLKRVLPPRAVDTPEELAELGQYVVNIIDFRDTDSTITMWTNPDVIMVYLQNSTSTAPGKAPTMPNPPYLYFSNASLPAMSTAYPFVHYGMEYNPVALNEVLAYSFVSNSGTGTAQNNRFFVELVNTLTQTAVNAYSLLNASPTVVPDASTLDLGGLNNAAPSMTDPYANGCWDLVFTADDPASRPDPYRGDLLGAGTNGPLNGAAAIYANTYGVVPLNKNSFSSGVDAILPPLTSTGIPPLPNPQTTPPTDYFYVIGNLPLNASYDPLSPSANTNPPLAQTIAPAFDPIGGTGTSTAITWYPGILPGATASAQNTAPTNYVPQIPPLVKNSSQANYYWVCLRRPANLFAPVSVNNPMVVVDSMRFPYIDGTVLPLGSIAGVPVPIPLQKANTPVMPAQAWIASNTNLGITYAGNAVYSAQRMQPYRGAHAVPVVTTPATVGATLDSRYGYTEQIAVPTGSSLKTQGIYYMNGGKSYYATYTFYHSLGQANSSSEPWDYFPFNDRDFTSVAELTMVPTSPPGLFTKQFAEFAPSSNMFLPAGSYNATGTTIFSTVTPLPTLAASGGTLALPAVTANSYATASTPFVGTIVVSTPSIMPHTFPYLQDKFFYSGASLPLSFPGGATLGSDTFQTSVNTAASDGWFKMFEFFEVPNKMIGSIGPVALGTNFDWARQDMKPGLLNLNLIIDEEVLFSVLGKGTYTTNPSVGTDTFSETLLNFMQIPALPNPNSLANPINLPLLGNYPTITYGSPAQPNPLPSPVPLVVSAIDVNGSPSYVYPISNTTGSGVTDTDPVLFQVNTNSGATPPPSSVDSRLKAAFVEFLWLRHGGSGYIFGNGGGQVGQNNTIIPVNPSPGYPGNSNNLPTGIPADRPFHSLSYPDIDYTVMRPSTLPPTLFTNPQPNPTPNFTTPATPIFYTGDPGVRNINLYPGYATGTIPTGSLTNPVAYPSLIPVRRLFQVPDYTSAATLGSPGPPIVPAYPFAPFASNAGDSGDPFVNNQIPANPGTVGGTAVTVPVAATGALPTVISYSSGNPSSTYAFTFNNLVTTMNTAAMPEPSNYSLYPGLAAGGSVTVTAGTPPTPPTVPIVDLGGDPSNSGGIVTSDNRQHPFFRMEMLQRVMSLTTPRTHQYAVWITIGFFEVKRPGDLGMLNSANPALAYDTMGPEVGAVTGKNIRYRGFYLIDRLQLTAFSSSQPGSFRPAVVYRQRIQ